MTLPTPQAKTDSIANTGAKTEHNPTIPKKIGEDPQLPSASPAQLLLSPTSGLPCAGTGSGLAKSLDQSGLLCARERIAPAAFAASERSVHPKDRCPTGFLDTVSPESPRVKDAERSTRPRRVPVRPWGISRSAPPKRAGWRCAGEGAKAVATEVMATMLRIRARAENFMVVLDIIVS